MRQSFSYMKYTWQPLEKPSPLVPAGLVEGAHEDAGRGNEFLKHVDRTRCLAYVIDLAGAPGTLVPHHPWDQLRVLQVGMAKQLANVMCTI